jgi:uncharacterized membrane protein YfcA
MQADIKEIEGMNFHPKKFSIIIGVLICSLFIIFARGGKGLDSIFGISRCDAWDWSIMAVYAVVIAVFAFVSYTVVLSEQNTKEKSGWVYTKHEKKFDKKFLITGNIIGILTGIIASLVGIGGGTITNPVLLSYNFMPTVVSFTSMYLIVANKIVADTVFILGDVMPLQYMFFIGLILVVGVLIVEWKLGQLVKKLGRQSFISFLFSGLLVIALVLVLIVGI